MADNPLSKLPVVGQLLVSVVIGAAIFGAFWFLVYTDKVAERDQKTTTLEKLNKDIAALEVTVSKLAEFQEQVKLLEAKLERLKLILPPQKETPDLMKKVQALASQSSLNIRKFNPKQTVSRDFYQEWPIDMDLEGTYHSLATFFDRMSRLPRLVNVGNVKIKALAQQKASGTISTGCVATTFVYVEPPPAPPAAAAPGGKGR
jgi:type IV pilus assembly protein PilO